MKQIAISGTSRAVLGKKAAKQVRKEGNVPCVLYGEQKDANGKPVAIHFVVSEKEINKLVYTPHIYLVDIKIDGVDHKAIIKEYNGKNALQLAQKYNYSERSIWRIIKSAK